MFQIDAIFDIYISQDSVATCLKHGGIFKHQFVANFPLSQSVKKFENRLIFGEVVGKSLLSSFLLTVYMYFKSPSFIQLSATLTKLGYINRNHPDINCSKSL